MTMATTGIVMTMATMGIVSTMATMGIVSTMATMGIFGTMATMGIVITLATMGIAPTSEKQTSYVNKVCWFSKTLINLNHTKLLHNFNQLICLGGLYSSGVGISQGNS